MKECWKKCKENPKYEVSSFGRVRRMYNGVYKVLSGSLHSKGYRRITLAEAGSYYIHRLVGSYFVPNPDGKPHINHKDGNKLNNDFRNLEWVTPAENNLHAAEVLGSTVIIPVVAIRRADRSIVGVFKSKKSFLELVGSTRGIVLVPEDGFSVDKIDSYLAKPPRKKCEKYIRSTKRGLSKKGVFSVLDDYYMRGIKVLNRIATRNGTNFVTVKGILSGNLYVDDVSEYFVENPGVSKYFNPDRIKARKEE